MDSFQLKATFLIALKVMLGAALCATKFALNKNDNFCACNRLTAFI